MKQDRLWSFVIAILGSMRIDACQDEIKRVLQNPNNCKEDYSACVGGNGALDLTEIKKFISRENYAGVPSCRKNGTMCFSDDNTCNEAICGDSCTDLNQMAMGLFLQIDNAAMEICKKNIEEAMTEVCGATDSCFESAVFDDDNFGEMDFCPVTTINGYTYNDSIAKSSSQSSRSNIWWGINRSSNSSWSAYSSSYDYTSLSMQTFTKDPSEPDADFCATVMVRNTASRTSNSDGNSSSNNSGWMCFFGVCNGSSNANNNSSSYASSNFKAELIFGRTADYERNISIATVELDQINRDEEATTFRQIVPMAVAINEAQKNKDIAERLIKMADGSTDLYAAWMLRIKAGKYYEASAINEDLRVISMEEIVADKINGVVSRISKDPKVSGCLFGRDLKNVTGRSTEDPRNRGTAKEEQVAEARFPRMFDVYAEVIIRDGKKLAMENYQRSVEKVKKELKGRIDKMIADLINDSSLSPQNKSTVSNKLKAAIQEL